VRTTLRGDCLGLAESDASISDSDGMIGPHLEASRSALGVDPLAALSDGLRPTGPDRECGGGGGTIASCFDPTTDPSTTGTED